MGSQHTWCKGTDKAYFYRRSVKLLQSCKNLEMGFSINTHERKQPASQLTHQHIRLSLGKQPFNEESFSSRFNEGAHVYQARRNRKVPYAFWGAVTGMTLWFVVKKAGFGGFFFNNNRFNRRPGLLRVFLQGIIFINCTALHSKGQ
jgi:hypothetical protein